MTYDNRDMIPTTAKPVRYSYLEIKEAQRVCGEKMMVAALLFAAALRKDNPENQEEVAPVDEELAMKLKQMETRLKEKQKAVKKLQEQVPRMAAANARDELMKARKRHANVLVTELKLTEGVGLELTEEQIEALKAAYIKTASSIAITSAKMSQVRSQTIETISIVEQAMKRPKMEVDLAMENSPVKPKALLNVQEKSSLQQPSPLRTRLALQLSASKNV
ncbi:unnamed protein product [Peronospora belbahrii]|uniref:Uncharacterized protein n=1 Tax=Peronospora belbahrii TaxID=622444 RepID=A0AAU9KYZ7_9STRA|nr:unnamed protein product [Peronospora belbahrii]